MANQQLGPLPENNTKVQAVVFGRYLIKKLPNKDVCDLFVHLLPVENKQLTSSDRKLLRLVTIHPRGLALVDAGLAIINPMSEVRHRLYIMLAILECQPEYHDDFLPKQRSWWYMFFVIYSGLRGLLKAGLGIVFVKAAGEWI